jgi:hypothetical protein
VASAPSRPAPGGEPQRPSVLGAPQAAPPRPTISRELAGMLQPRGSGAAATRSRGEAMGGEAVGRGEGAAGGGRGEGASGATGGGKAAAGAGPGKAAPGAVPDEARAVAEKWLAAYTRGDARWLAGYSALPFSAGGRTVADSGEALRAMYRQMLGERAERGGALSFFTPAQIRKRLGKLPAGGDEEDMMFALLKGGGDDIVLLLQPADKGWRVVGLDR